jgi:hypothetical protein
LHRISKRTLGAVLIAMLQACTVAPREEQEMREVDAATNPPAAGDVAAPGEPLPELTLNLDQPDCECTAPQQGRDKTFLDRGFVALVEGDHIEAVQYFQRYQRLEKSPLSAWEAGISVAYVSTLQHSPFYDPVAARKSYRRLQKEFDESWQVDERVLLLTMSLESFRVMYRHVDDLEDTNSTLREDLEKREEALKRLRELTLGQKATRQ